MTSQSVNDQTFAPEWGDGYVLTWSGKWHIPDPRYKGGATLCGACGYKHFELPANNRRLQDIATGRKDAPKCRKCEKTRRE